MQAVPKIGNRHSFFDDGKMRESRHYIAEVLRVIEPEESKYITFDLDEYDADDNVRKVKKTLYEVWREEIDQCRQGESFKVIIDGASTKPGAPWCYAEETDFFVECSIPEYDENTIWFVRHVSGGWFSMDIQQSWMSGKLMPVEFNADEYFRKQAEDLEKWLSEYNKN